MPGDDWSRIEVEAIVDDYMSMLASELAGTPYNKAAHRRALRQVLTKRSDQSIEFKHANLSAALLDAGFPYIVGYKPRSNYQQLIVEVLADRLSQGRQLHELAAADAERPIAVPEVDDILAVLIAKPPRSILPLGVSESLPAFGLKANYIEREARNRSLGHAGELFVLNYERARLIALGKESLAGKIEHTSQVRGDHEGFDILSFDEAGGEQFIEVKTTKYGIDTPFFVTRNEVATSDRRAVGYHVYRLFGFRLSPRLYVLPGAISASCHLSAATFLASPR
jgi:hypothetical protein